MSLGRVPLPTIPVGATQPIVFDFTDTLAQGETISSATVTLSVYSGTDGAPSGNKSGSTTISGALVSQKIKPVSGALGNIYQVLCDAVTSLSNTFQKAGLLAVPPDTDTTVTVTNSVSPVIAELDTGVISIAVGDTPLLTAAQNVGGMYQLNNYLVISNAGTNGTITLNVKWYDKDSGALMTRIAAILTATSTGDSETTFPVDVQAGTQILVNFQFSGVTGAIAYQGVCTVSRL